MAQNNPELSNEMKEFIVTPSSYEIQMPVLDKTVMCDVSGDFVLPDYLPEIKRLLRVTPSLAESSKYVGGNTAEFAGAINYTVLYTDNDGRIFCAPLSSDYEFECRSDAPDAELSSENLICDTDIDSVSCRPVGPRKLVIKSRLRSRVRSYENDSIPERTVGAASAEDEFSVERLKREYPTAFVVRGAGEEINVEGELVQGGVSGAVKPIFCEGRVAVLDASCTDGGVSVRAELVLRALLEKEDGELLSSCKRFPVSDTVELGGVGRDFDCRAWGRCTSVSVSAERSEDERSTRLLCDATVVFEAEARKNVSATVSEDAFSTLCECECGVKEYELPYCMRTVCTTFSFSHSLPLSDVGVDADGEIVDLCGDAAIEKVESAHGKCTAVGVCRASAVISGPEVQSTEFDLPFRYEFDAEAGDIADFDATATVTSLKSRAEGENMAVDCEISLALSVFGKNAVGVVDTLTLNKNKPHPDDRSGASFVIFYPDKSDSLWSVAKRYHTPLSRLTEANEPLPRDVASPASLSGRDFIIFEK